MRPPFLRYARMVSFGSVQNKTVGPFEPGLNVVFGRNEAGKTTLASFIEGLLFGWEEARGSRNTYKPDNAERAGSLFFADAQGGEIELSRVRNVDGLKGDASLVADIDRDTFRTMFSLTSDELRSLRNAGDVTARLLTAGSGTDVSPAQALGQVNDALAGYTSRAASADHSLVRLAAEREELRLKLRSLGDEMDQLKHLDAEFHQMEAQRSELAAHLAELNDEVECLAACRARVDKMDAEIAQLASDKARLLYEEAEASAALEANAQAFDALKTEGVLDEATRQVSARRTQGASSAPFALHVALGLLIVVFLAAGAGLILYGQRLEDAAFAALGAVLLVAACASLAVAFALVFASQKKAQALVQEDAIRQEIADRQLRDRALQEAGLKQQLRMAGQRGEELSQRLSALEAQRAAALERAGLLADASVEEIDFEMARTARERDALMEDLEGLNARYGEMRQLLAHAAGREDFADMKIEYQAVRTRLLDATQDFMRLLLAKRMLEKAIAEWEIESQPAVYREAGRLLSLMTDGAWTRVSASSDGSLVVGNEERLTRPAQKLSLGTCQQLYLSMRIALLMAADEVGRSAPVIADDILVNFDARRRRGAARALAELAQVRQVILLTCHEEVAQLLVEAQPDARVIRL